MSEEIDTSNEAVERHLEIEHNHEAGLIPVSTRMLLRALAAERDALRQRAEKADEYHAIANAYAEWAGDMFDAIEGRIEDLDPDSHSDQQLLSLLNRAEAGIAAETRRALRQDEGDDE